MAQVSAAMCTGRLSMLIALAAVAILQCDRSGAVPLLVHLILPRMCDVVVIKSVENGRYLGASRMSGVGSDDVRAAYSHKDPNSRFVVNYSRGTSGPMALSVKVSTDATDLRHRLLGFDGSVGVMKEECTFGNCSWVETPRGNLLAFRSWPLINLTLDVSVSFIGGPFFRLYVLDDATGREATAVAGVSDDGQLVALPLDAAAQGANVPFVDPSTLFLIDVVSSPGRNSCSSMV